MKHAGRFRSGPVRGDGPRYSLDPETGEYRAPLGIRPGMVVTLLKHHVEEVTAGRMEEISPEVLEMVESVMANGWYVDPVSGRRAWVHARPLMRLTKLFSAFTDRPMKGAPKVDGEKR